MGWSSLFKGVVLSAFVMGAVAADAKEAAVPASGERMQLTLPNHWEATASLPRPPGSVDYNEFTPKRAGKLDGRQNGYRNLYKGDAANRAAFQARIEAGLTTDCAKSALKDRRESSSNGYPTLEFVTVCHKFQGGADRYSWFKAIEAGAGLWVMELRWRGPIAVVESLTVPGDEMADWEGIMRRMTVCNPSDTRHPCASRHELSTDQYRQLKRTATTVGPYKCLAMSYVSVLPGPDAGQDNGSGYFKINGLRISENKEYPDFLRKIGEHFRGGRGATHVIFSVRDMVERTYEKDRAALDRAIAEFRGDLARKYGVGARDFRERQITTCGD